ncbi:MAG TPA: VWA domain-containing protein [Bryobacteraceae bacterium]
MRDFQQHTRRRFLLAAASATASLRAQSQSDTPQGDAIFTSAVKVVNTLATVQTKQGKLINDLTKDDFTLSEDGRPQNIRYFSQQTDLPLTIGLMVDTSMSQGRVMNDERGASTQFLDQMFRENKDHVFLMQFDMTIRLRQPLTGSLKPLYDVLPFVDTPTRKELSNGGSAGTLLFDSMVKAANEIMKPLQGRKALIVLSDGVDVGSDSTAADAVDAAQRADTLIYSIEFSDASYYGGFVGGNEGRNALMKMANETGGAFFSVNKKVSINQIFSLIESELRNQYSIGYISDKPCTISEFRKLQLQVKQKGLIVQARNRYWARP